MRITEKASLWPQLTAQSCQINKVSPDKLQELNKAQLFLWRALNIYDDFLDNEGIPANLPLANNYFRLFLKTIYQEKVLKNYLDIVEQILEDLEKANLEEIKREKIIIKNHIILPKNNIIYFSNLESLSRKSLSLAILPLTVYLYNNCKIKEINNFLDFFRSALSAKQLADDLRDWYSDLINKKMTPVTELLLDEIKTEKIKISINEKNKLSALFLVKPLFNLNTSLLNLIKESQEKSKKLNFKNSAPLLINILEPLERKVNIIQKLKDML
jgi:hypothetical protein